MGNSIGLSGFLNLARRMYLEAEVDEPPSQTFRLHQATNKKSYLDSPLIVAGPSREAYPRPKNVEAFGA